MKKGYIVTGTDTDIGKTVFAAALTYALGATYWKPIQCGTERGTDRETVEDLVVGSEATTLPEAYLFQTPVSPHRAAELEKVDMDMDHLALPQLDKYLVVEGAGGLMVPLTRKKLSIDLFKEWDLPVILCARTSLGTINHTLLSLEALKARQVLVHGIAFLGDEVPDSMFTITAFSGVKMLGFLPRLEDINSDSLNSAFQEHFSLTDFL
jgi:dethiobiotin synthetase